MKIQKLLIHNYKHYTSQSNCSTCLKETLNDYTDEEISSVLKACLFKMTYSSFHSNQLTNK